MKSIQKLRITVDWLDGIYHGEEWPPSPLRVFQAMIGGYSMYSGCDLTFEPAMRHLESLPTPNIYAPKFEERSRVISAVPNNDGDCVTELHAKGKQAEAFHKARKITTLRLRNSRYFKGSITYEWEANAETTQHIKALKTIASFVSAVGQGIDVVVARAELVEFTEPVAGVKYIPSTTGRRKLTIPYPGGLEVLNVRYQKFLNRSKSMLMESEPTHKQSGYKSELDLPPIKSHSFAFRDIANQTLAINGTRTVDVTTMVRKALCNAAYSAGLAKEEIAEFSGYCGSRRIRIHPLPNVGHKFADGQIRRVMLTADESFDEEIWQDIVLSRLTGEYLIPEGESEPIGLLTSIEESDAILFKYCGEGKSWTTATPVIFPGFDSQRGRPRPERIIGRILQHARISETMLVSVTMEPAARFYGSYMPMQYQRPEHLKKYPCRHMSIQWMDSVKGPICLGAGIGYGLGLFIPLKN